MSKRWHKFVSEVCNRLGNVRLWIASSKGTNLPPELHKETLTVPLRSAPSVVVEVDKGVRALENIPDYTCAGIPAPLDGPQVIRLHHQGPGHLEANIVECEQCGRNIATELQQLKVGAGQGKASSTLQDVFISKFKLVVQYRSASIVLFVLIIFINFCLFYFFLIQLT